MQNSSFYIVKYLTPNLRCLLCNVLTQPHFNYVCIGWYSNLSKKIEKKKKKNQTSQNNCIRLSAGGYNGTYISKRM